MKCNQHDCNEDAAFLFTWPGKDQIGICQDHSGKLKGIAAAMGLHLQLIPIQPEAEED